MSIHNKIVHFDSAIPDIGDDFALCYGHFNLIHPGHLRYLQYAKTLASKLVVVLTSDKELNKDPNNSNFKADERAESVASIQIVDYVIILKDLTLDKLIFTIKPSVLLLGKEFEYKQSKELKLAIKAATAQGRVVFHAGETHYASSNLLQSNVSDIESASTNQFNTICNNHNIDVNTLQDIISRFSDTKLLIIGDTIVDNYVACDAIGMSAEAPVLVVKELENREFVGGAAIVASHVKALGAQCHYISVLGDDSVNHMVVKVLNDRGIIADLVIDSSRPTTYKTRYMVENQKLFRVSRIMDHKISKKIEKDIINNIHKLSQNIDGIMISDFVYGVVTNDVLYEIYSAAKKYNIKLFGDLQCSSQVGNVSKFKGFDLITPTEKESRFALNDNDSGIEWIANKLLKDTDTKNMLLKLGSEGFIAYSNKKPIERQNFPALTANPVDVTGAGDSLFAAMSLSLSSGASLVEASAIGTCMASLAVKEIGNTPISRADLNKCIVETLGNNIMMSNLL